MKSFIFFIKIYFLYCYACFEFSLKVSSSASLSSTKKRIRRASEQSRQSKPELKPSDFGVDNIRSNKSSISSDSDSSDDGPKPLREDFNQKSSQTGDVQQKFDQANLIASNSDVSSETSTEERILAKKISTSKKFPNMESLRGDSKVYEHSCMINSKSDLNDTSELDTKSTTSSSDCDSSSDSSQDLKTSLQLEQKQQSQKFDSDTTVDSYKGLKNAIKVRNFHCMVRIKIL